MEIRLTAAAFMITLVIVAAFLLYPQINRYMELKNELDIKVKIYENKEAAYGQYEEKWAELEQLSTKYQLISEILPPLHKMTEKIVSISKLLEQHGLTEREFSIGDTTKKEIEGGVVFKTTVTVTAVGSYDGVMDYIACIEGLSNVCTVDDVIMSSENIAANGEVNFVLRITVYAAQEELYERQKEGRGYEDYTGNPFYYD